MRTLAIVVAIGSASGAALAGARPQPPVNTDVYLASFTPGPTAGIAAVANISNDPDYDNQPSFTPDSRAVLFASKRDGKQTDIYRYDIASRALTQLTHTAESEYSPLVTPDGQSFSVIRVEADGTQRLWRFDLDGTNPRLVLENVKPVGYHAWIDATHLALFVLGAQGQPNTLQIADTTTGKADIAAPNIGRSLGVRPGTSPPRVTFVNKSVKPWALSEINPAAHAPEAIAPLSEGSDGATAEDYAWDPSADRGQFLVAWGTTIVANAPSSPSSAGGRSWRRVADLSTSGLTNITRMAVSPDAKWIAFVAQPATSAIARRP